MKNLFWLVTCGMIMACSSVPQQSQSPMQSPENQADKVLSRIDDLSARPSWLRESEPFRIEGGYVTSLGQTVIPADNRVEAAYRISENNAKSAIAGAIEQRLEFIFQNAEEGTEMDTTQARYIGAEASKLTTSSLRLDRRYWEKIATTTDSGQRVTQYRVFTTVKIPESDFKRAVMDAIRRSQGRQGISAEFAQKVNEHWDKFVNGEEKKTSSTTDTTANAEKSAATEKHTENGNE
jgi:hypothetical protein